MKRLSLHFGANYPGTSAELRGCVNDAEDWAEALFQRGYEPTVHTEPTRSVLLGEMAEAVGRLGYRDRLLISYSGHGTWVPDREPYDEADGRDEALVPVDYAHAGVVTDDDLLRIWDRIPYGARVIFVSDSCHSGTMTRTLRAPEPAVRETRFLSPAVVTDVDIAVLEAVAGRPARGLSRPSRVALLSGCTDGEVSFDALVGNRYRGAASWAYLAALQGGNPALRTWHARAASLLERSPWKAQHPQLQGTAWQRGVWAL